jgi:hypothetical protein
MDVTDVVTGKVRFGLWTVEAVGQAYLTQSMCRVGMREAWASPDGPQCT